MFGDMGKMMEQLQQMQSAVENAKDKLENIYVKGESKCGGVRFVMNGNKKLKDVYLKPELLEKDIEEIQDILVLAFNKALEDAEHINENEMKNTAGGFLPGMGL